jgi:hypothetical protein
MPPHTSHSFSDRISSDDASEDTSWSDIGHDNLSYPVCEQARDHLISCAETPQSQHLPRGAIPYFPEAAIVAFLKDGKRGEKMFFCRCAKCRRQAGRKAGIENRAWNKDMLLGPYATIYALLIYLRCPALVWLFRREKLTLDHYLTSDNLNFLDDREVLEPIQTRNLCAEILRDQYQFLVSKFVKDNEITKIKEDEILPIKEKQIPAGEGNFGEVYEMTIDPGYVDKSLESLKVNIGLNTN